MVAHAHLKQGFLHTHFTGHLQGRAQDAASEAFASLFRRHRQIEYFQFIKGMIYGNIGQQFHAPEKSVRREGRLRKGRAALRFRPGQGKAAPFKRVHQCGVARVKTFKKKRWGS